MAKVVLASALSCWLPQAAGQATGESEQLAFGSTTGGLWSSGDQGDHWHLLPARLPPIHAVTFVD